MLFLQRRIAQSSYFQIRNYCSHNKFKQLANIVALNNKNSNLQYYVKYVVLFCTGYAFAKFYSKDHWNTSVAAVSDLKDSKLRRKQFNFVADVVDSSAPAVVYIEIKDSRRFDFFTGKPLTVSNGSGFIIKENGLILTNAHVVANKPNSKVEVRLHNGTVYTGRVEDVDVKSDLATVRISATNLPTMKLGNSADLRPGEFVVAIGSPLALSNSVTFGVISSVNRASEELGLRGRDMVYLQTDAAITFGNSGGPLVNLEGEAIGVNSMKVTAGISFAIPSDYVKEFLNSTSSTKSINKTHRARKYMGITMLTLTPQILYELQQRNQFVPRDIKNGVLVWKVILGSPAHTGGIQPGDIVTHIDGKEISDANDVYIILSKTTSKTLTVTVNRNGKKIDLFITPENVDD